MPQPNGDPEIVEAVEVKDTDNNVSMGSTSQQQQHGNYSQSQHSQQSYIAEPVMPTQHSSQPYDQSKQMPHAASAIPTTGHQQQNYYQQQPQMGYQQQPYQPTSHPHGYNQQANMSMPAMGYASNIVNSPQAQHQMVYQQQQGHPGGKYGFITGKRNFAIHQRFEGMEAMAQAIGCDCIETQNKYDIFDAHTGQPLYYVKEKSDTCIRCLCHPHHSAKLFVYDVRHPQFSIQNPPKSGVQHPSLIMTVDKPFKFNCPMCLSICAHEQTATLTADQSRLGSAIKTPPCGGYCTPEIDVKDDKGGIYAKVVGPTCCVGGLIELCSPVSFKIEDGEGKNVIGHLEKKKPKGMGALHEAMGDADQFFLSLPDKMDDAKAANFIATLLLLDYIFFEGGAPFEYENGGLKINCFNCYCFGCTWPCEMNLGGSSGDN